MGEAEKAPLRQAKWAIRLVRRLWVAPGSIWGLPGRPDPPARRMPSGPPDAGISSLDRALEKGPNFLNRAAITLYRLRPFWDATKSRICS